MSRLECFPVESFIYHLARRNLCSFLLISEVLPLCWATLHDLRLSWASRCVNLRYNKYVWEYTHSCDMTLTCRSHPAFSCLLVGGTGNCATSWECMSNLQGFLQVPSTLSQQTNQTLDVPVNHHAGHVCTCFRSPQSDIYQVGLACVTRHKLPQYYPNRKL